MVPALVEVTPPDIQPERGLDVADSRNVSGLLTGLFTSTGP